MPRKAPAAKAASKKSAPTAASKKSTAKKTHPEKKPPRSLGTIASRALKDPKSLTPAEIQSLGGRVEADRKYGAKRTRKASGLAAVQKEHAKVKARSKTVKRVSKRSPK